MLFAYQLLNFIYSEKATKFSEISTVDLSYVVTVKSTVEISQNFVAFSEYMNFNTLCILTTYLNFFNCIVIPYFCLISGITKATPLKQYPQEEPNRTDPNEVITNIKSGEIKTANLNNVPISEEKVLDLCQALRNNETLTVNNSQ